MFESQVTLISMAKYGRNAGCYSKMLQRVTQVGAQQVCCVPQTLPAVASDVFQVTNLLDLSTKHIVPSYFYFLVLPAVGV